MHYYKLNIGDYRRDTSHLTMLEHGAYRQLLDSYYLNEKPLPLDDAILMRTHSARNADEMQAIRNVLQDFFVRTDDGWVHRYCDRVIDGYHAKSDKAKDSANARWANKQATSSERNANAMRTHSEGNANHKPLTTNQEPSSNTLSALPAKTDQAPSRLNGKTQMVSEVMAYLNLQARRNYRVSNPNGTPTAGALVIAQRLKEGYTVDQCKDVIGEKSNQWMGDEKMDQYLNPQTLFRKSNFDKYLTEAEAAS